jgi:folate-dependent phosphoribosylglycinamide formyltransferase PurN
MKHPLRLGVLGSGKGSNFRAIMEQIVDGRLDAEVRIVISDVENAGILSFARDFQIPALYVRPGRFRTRLESRRISFGCWSKRMSNWWFLPASCELLNNRC